MSNRSTVRFWLTASSLVALLALLFSSCAAQGTPTKTTASPSAAVAQKGGTWVDDLFNEPDSLIPDASVQTAAYQVDQTIFTGLFMGDASGQIHPGLVAEMPTTQNKEISTDLKSWTFKLRPNLKWSDGQPLNADDVDYTWKLWVNPAFAAADTVAFRLITSTEVSSDKLSITFHLSAPYAPFISSWTDGRRGPLPKHHYGIMDPAAIKKSENLNPQVVSGPFVMSESKPGDHYTVVRNPLYYRSAEGLPYLDKIVFRMVPNQNTILKDFQAGAIDAAWFLDVTKMQSYKALTNYKIVTATSASYEAIHFDGNNPIFKDAKVKQAIAMAINRDELVTVARLGQAQSSCTDHGLAYHPGYQADAPCPKFDTAAANQLLEQDGWIMKGDVRQKGGQQLVFQYSTTANNRWREKDEALIQADLAKIGVKLVINNYPGSTFFGPFLKGGQPGKYDLAEYASSYTYDPDSAVGFACSQIPPHGGNINFYCNTQLDQLLTQEVATADPAARQQVFNKIHQIFLSDFPIVVLYNLLDVAAVKNGAHNYNIGPFGASETVMVDQWWCDNGKCPHV